MTIVVGKITVQPKKAVVDPSRIPERTWTLEEAERQVEEDSRIWREGDWWLIDIWCPVSCTWTHRRYRVPVNARVPNAKKMDPRKVERLKADAAFEINANYAYMQYERLKHQQVLALLRYTKRKQELDHKRELDRRWKENAVLAASLSAAEESEKNSAQGSHADEDVG